MRCSPNSAANWGYEHGWGYGRHFSPFGLFFGVAILALLFKTGLWLPLVGIGFLMFLFSQNGGGPRRHGRRGGMYGRPGLGGKMRPNRRRGWHGGDEKPKRGFGPFGGTPWYGPTVPETEKPKREFGDDEYV